MSAKIH